MFDFGDSTNVISLKIMNYLGLNIMIPYRNVCGIDSRANPIFGLIKDLKVNPSTYPDISLLMDVIVIDVCDAWGMLFSRKWVVTLGENLHMDLSFSRIPNLDGDFVTIYRELVVRYQVEDPQNIVNEIMYLDEMVGNFFKEIMIFGI
jgi:hypothetical protein